MSTRPRRPSVTNPVGEVVAQAEASLAESYPTTDLTPAALAPTGLAPAAAIGEVSVPRIAIHVFAERQDTLAAAERAAQDRRLSRATTQIRIGGVAAAVETYQHEPTPPLIIVECLKDPQTLLWEVDQLAEVCDAGTKVVVVGATNDIILFRELMRRGVSEYLVAPLQPLQLIAAIGGLFNDPAQPFVGRTIAFVGARGGAGASAVAHNTAYAISERIGANTVIVDYDLPFGTAGLDFNQDPLSGVADAPGPTRPAGLHPSGQDDGPLHGQAEPVRRAGQSGHGLGHFDRGVRRGDEPDPRHRAVRGAGPAPPVVAVDAPHPDQRRRGGGGGDPRSGPACATPRT